jgi:hypothetical protein
LLLDSRLFHARWQPGLDDGVGGLRYGRLGFEVGCRDQDGVTAETRSLNAALGGVVFRPRIPV